MATIDLSNVKFPIVNITKTLYDELDERDSNVLYVIRDAVFGDITMYLGDVSLSSIRDGLYFTPAIDEAGNLSWENNGNLDNPNTVNIKGRDGLNGRNG